MRSPAARALAFIGATALAVSGTVALTAVPAHAAEDHEWDISTPLMSHDDKYSIWSPTLTNSTGETVADVTVSLSISVPGGGPSPVRVELEDPDGNIPAAPCEVADGKSATCEVDLEPGDNEYQLYLLRNREVDLDDNDTVGLHAKATQSGTELAAADGQLTIKHNANLDRVEFHDVPKEVSTDRTRPGGVKWSFTITNDSNEGAIGGYVVIELSSAAPPGLELGATEGEGACSEDSDTSVTCDEVSLSKGESITIDMKLFADGTTEGLAEKVTLSVDMTAATEEEFIDFAYGEAHTRAVVDDGSGNGSLPVTGSSLSGYLTAGAAVILLGAGILFLTRRRVARL